MSRHTSFRIDRSDGLTHEQSESEWRPTCSHRVPESTMWSDHRGAPYSSLTETPDGAVMSRHTSFRIDRSDGLAHEQSESECAANL